jgi:hypothetical protein
MNILDFPQFLTWSEIVFDMYVCFCLYSKIQLMKMYTQPDCSIS